jgi:hypothetical protein
MKRYLILILLGSSLTLSAQSIGVKVGDKIRASSWAYGLQAGQLTGVNFQYTKGYACGGRKNDFSKEFYLEFAFGVDRLFNESEYFEKKDIIVYGDGLRGHLNFQITYLHLTQTDFTMGLGLQLGERDSFYDLGFHNQTTFGIRPGMAVEHYFLRTGSGSKPNYFSVFLDAFWYKEFSPGFNDFHLNAGLRLNLFR